MFLPQMAAEGKNPLQLDSKEPSIPLQDYIYTENRYRMLQKADAESAARLLVEAQEDVRSRWRAYAEMAANGTKAGE